MENGQPVANGHAPETETKTEGTANGTPTLPQSASSNKPRPKRKKGPNYAQIHSKPLPLEVHPLPAFHPSHPLSLLQLCYVYISHLLFPPTSHPPSRYVGDFSQETRSVHITDPASIRALWEMGFFGKGTLSRSEPSWLAREKAKVVAERDAKREGAGGNGGDRKTAEEVTRARRDDRRLFKLERARVERERIERQRAVEEGRMSVEEAAALDAESEEKVGTVARARIAAGSESQPAELLQQAPTESTTDQVTEAEAVGRVPDAALLDPAITQTDMGPLLPDLIVTNPAGATTTAKPELEEHHEAELLEAELDIENQEHLQLTLEEAFFLSYGLGVLDIIITDPTTFTQPTNKGQRRTSAELLRLFTQHSTFPPQPPLGSTVPPADSPFLLNYVTYHHFRSLGWVVRPGVKFAVDYMLYNRGPVFSHAEFAVLIFPAYTAPYWSTEEGLRQRRVKKQKDWWWLHGVNRVQSQAVKTLVLCYVDVPAPEEMQAALAGEGGGKGEGGVTGLLKRYKVREFTLRRWLANRSRD